MSENLLLIFTRNPELGKVKTRLAQGVGKENALAIYKTLLEHTRDVLMQVDCVRRVGYSVRVREDDIWDEKHFEKFEQEGQDLGVRMYNAFAKAYSDGYKNVLIIGSDLFDLRPKHIEEAFTALQHNEVVIGPAKDGGYYLLGMKTLIKDIFYNKQWGSESVLKDTMSDLKSYKVQQLEVLNDIDYAEDLAPYPAFAHYLN